MTPNSVPLSPISFLNRAADVFPSKVAVVATDGRHISYDELRTRCARLADRLLSKGYERGNRVAVLAGNDLLLLEAHFGVPAAGCVLLPLNTRLAPQEYAYILRHSGARLLIIEADFTDRIEPVRDDLSSLEIVVVATGADSNYESWLGKEATDSRLTLPDDEMEPITINYTSGTTGHPKGAVYTHRGAYLNSMGQALSFGLDARSVFLWTLPMFHCNGWCFVWAVTAVAGQHVCLAKFDASLAVSLVAEQQVTHLCGAPIVLNMIADEATGAGSTFSSPIRAATGGSAPSSSMIARLSALGIDLVHLYGLTETYGPSLICEPQDYWTDLTFEQRAKQMARQGVRTINVEGVRVIDDLGKDVPADGLVQGEIVVRSNTVMDHYWRDDHATAEAFSGGWFHTGDLAVRHPDGYIEVRDRAKDLIISGGENVSSIEVENIICSHPGVSEAAVVAQPHPRWGEVPVAFVTRRPGVAVTEDEIVVWVQERLARFKAPRRVVFQELPKTSTGKVKKSDLREVARAIEVPE